MLNKIVVTNPKGEALELELTNPEKSGFTVAKVEGLGPPKANINGQDMASADGMFYTSARAESRQIIFTLEFRSRTADSQYGELTIEQCRRRCYRYFPLKKEITITVYTDEQVLYTTGYVESNEPEIFSMQEYATISVLCPDPWMYATSQVTVMFSQNQPSFEFPFSNESLTSHLIELGTIWLEQTLVIDYFGTIDTGVNISIDILNDCDNITIYNLNTDGYMIINASQIEKITGHKPQANDHIAICTIRGQRGCTLTRGTSRTYNIIGALNENMEWFMLTNGINEFGFSVNFDPSKLLITFTYQNAYVGV